MIASAIAFTAGQLAAAWWSVPLSLVLASLALRLLAGRGRVAKALGSMTVLLGGAWLAGMAVRPPEGGCWLPGPEEAPKRWIVAEVVRPAEERGDDLRARVRAHVENEGPVCGEVLLTFAAMEPPPLVGDRFRAHVKIRRPRNFGNPGAFDYEAHLARRGIWATAVTTGPAVERLPSHEGIGRRLDRWRSHLREVITLAIDGPERGLLLALVLGEVHAVDPAVREGLARVGLGHLLAISGLHVGIVWGCVGLGLHWLGSRSERLLLQTRWRAVAFALALIPTTVYALLAGGRIPTERAVTMITVVVLAMVVSREGKPLRALALAAWVVGLLGPGAAADPGFQLSFSAVAAILLGLGHPRGFVRTTVRVSTLAVIGTAPLSAFWFQRVSPAGLFLNPWLVPLAGVPATALALVAAASTLLSTDLATSLFRLASLPLVAIRVVSEQASRVPFAFLDVPPPTLAELALLYGSVLIVKLGRFRGWVAAVLVVAATADAVFWVHERYGSEDVRIRFLDVGQGDATVIELPGGGVIVVDGGGLRSPTFDVGERVVAPYLRSRRILSADVIVATHGDHDHVGGLSYVATVFSPRELWRTAHPAETAKLAGLESIVRDGGGRVRMLRPGERIDVSADVTIRCLHPPPDVHLARNDRSLVLLVAVGSIGVLLPGDVERAGEALLLGEFSQPVDVVKVPHHGSATSSHPALVSRLRPRLAIVSAGAGFARLDVLERYEAVGATVRRTDRDGSILVESGPRGLRIRSYSESRPVFCSTLGILC